MSRILLRSFQPDDLPALVAFWNHAFRQRRNGMPVTAASFRRRVLESPAFDPNGLILAWATGQGDETHLLVGMVHAFKPPTDMAIFARLEPRHHLALLYVAPAWRRQGIGSRLLRAAQDWLYYCPVHVADQYTPCYGSVEGPRAPFFGSSERMGIGANERQTLHFFANRGYGVVDPGDVSMTRQVGNRHPAPPPRDLAAMGLRMVEVDNAHPFQGTEPPTRIEYTLWGSNRGDPYAGLVLVDGSNHMVGHMSWYPLTPQVSRPGDGSLEHHLALGNLWLTPALRQRGLGAYLLDQGLHVMTVQAPVRIELHTHLVHHPRAVTMYERRGFIIDMAWVNLVKT